MKLTQLSSGIKEQLEYIQGPNQVGEGGVNTSYCI